MSPPPLEDQARVFAETLTATVRAIAPDSAPFSSKVISKPDGHEGFTVHQEPADGVPLTVVGQVLPRLAVSYKCSPDSPGHFLAVEESAIAEAARRSRCSATSTTGTQPMTCPQPTSRSRAHRDAFFDVMSRTGEASARGRRRARSDTMARLEDLHFPVGGHRFRPCLEDVLEMLATEFGIDSSREDRQRLCEGREEWRRKQARTVVRDAAAAADSLRTEGGQQAADLQ